MRGAGLVLCGLVIAPVAAGSTFIESGGKSAPPAMIGPWDAVEVPDPDVPDHTIVTSIQTLGRDKAFSFSPNGLEKLTVPDTWATWSYGYAGPVYAHLSSTAAVQINFAGSKDWRPVGFSLAVEPNHFGGHQFTIGVETHEAGHESIQATIFGQGGAKRWNIWTTTEGDWIERIWVKAAPSADGFAMGDFALASIPEPASLGLLALGGLALMRRRQARGHRRGVPPAAG